MKINYLKEKLRKLAYFQVNHSQIGLSTSLVQRLNIKGQRKNQQRKKEQWKHIQITMELIIPEDDFHLISQTQIFFHQQSILISQQLVTLSVFCYAPFSFNNQIFNPTMPENQNNIAFSSNITSQTSQNIQNESFKSMFSSSDNFQYGEDFSLQKLFQLYLYEGSSWKFIKSQLKSEIKDPKNFIYNAIRRSAKTLSKYEIDILGKRRRLINRDTLLSMLEIVNQVQKEIINRGLTLNQDCQLFRFKKSLLRFSLWQNSFSEDEICEMIRMMKTMNLKLRCLSIFKAKSRKNWKISEKALSLICSFDRVTVEPQPGFELSHGQSITDPEKGRKESRVYEQDEHISDYSLEVQSIFFQIKGCTEKIDKSLMDEADQILKIRSGDPDILQYFF